jgi:AraC-like DNA-binding protein
MRMSRVKEQRFAALKPAGDGVVGKGMVRVGTLMAVPGLLQERGVDPAPMLAEFRLEPAYFEHPDNTIAFATEGRILARCAALTHCPHFGLLTGQRDSASALGAVGFLLRNSFDVRTALGELTRHFQVHNPNAMVSLVEEDSFAALGYTILQTGIEHLEQILDEATALGFNLMRELCGPNWLPTEVRFAHARPPDLAPFRQFFRATLRFDANETALVFARHWLDKAPPGADPLLHQMMVQHVRDLESLFGEDLVSQLRQLLPSLVTAHSASRAVVAERIGLGARTLSRRLAAEGASFMQLREEACYTIACQLLASTRLPANEIADLIGYANPSAFTRAFYRWTGMGPAQWRASRRRPFL